MIRPRVSIGKRSANMVGAAGPYPPSPIPTKIRVANRMLNVAARPEPPLATLHKITAEPMMIQRYARSASRPRIGALTMYVTKNASPNQPVRIIAFGSLGDAFFVTYMVSAPILGLLADRVSRWLIIGSAVILWSLASGASGLAATFAILFATRICVGIGEGGYGPAASTILADLFPIETRGRMM